MPNTTKGELNRLGVTGDGIPGGVDGDIQFNNAGSFGGVDIIPVSNGGTGADNLSQLGADLISDATTLRKFRADLATFNASGINQIVILGIGDSLELGVGATAQTNVTRYMANLITTGYGAFAQSSGFMGAGNTSNRRASYDNRISLGAGWGYNDAVASLGGVPFSNSTTTNALAFTPDSIGDRLRVIYRITSGGGLFTVDADGASTSTNIDCDGADAIGSFLYAGTGTTYNIKRVSGGAVEIIGMYHYSSTNSSILLVNCGESGVTAEGVAASGTWSPLAVAAAIDPNLCVVSLGTNDWSFADGVTLYKTSLDTIYNSLSAHSDVAFVSPVPANPADPFAYNVSLAVQQTYVTGMAEIAAENNCLFVDMFARWTDYASGNALGYYAGDNFHVSAKGYVDCAVARAMAIFGQGRNLIQHSRRTYYDTVTYEGYRVSGAILLTQRGGTSILMNGTNGSGSTGPWNVVVGFTAGDQLGASFNNVAVGFASIPTSGTKQGNTAVGAYAATTLTTGSYNTIIGCAAGYTTLTTGNANIIIGRGDVVATTPAAGTSNYVNVGNSIIGYSQAPTIASGFGTSPAITATGTFAFVITVGTGGSATSGVLTFPTAPTGWIVHCTDMTNPATNRTVMTASSATSVTLKNYNTTTGTETAWTAGDALYCIAMAY